jgi:putative PIN family toxin of toxin-antitoxin system
VRLVLDTNVLIAAFVARGVCHELLEHCQREHALVTSDLILAEFEAKLLQKFKVPPLDAREARELLASSMHPIAPEPLDAAVCRDPDDDWVLVTAVTGRCACLVTGDKDLLVLRRFQAIVVLAPSEFWAYARNSA